jgi:hypothetical protein
MSAIIRRPTGLPTFEQVRLDAYRELGGVLEVLASDWASDSCPTKGAGWALVRAKRLVMAAQEALNQAAP